MGQLKSDGRAINVTFPAGIIPFGDLFRIDGWTGIALVNLVAADTVRTGAMEVSAERIWYVKVPAGVTAARGNLVYWTAGAGFKRGDTDLTQTPTGGAVGIIEEAKDANNYAGIRVFNGANLVV